MARGDFWVQNLEGAATQRFLVKAGAAASIKAGEPVIQNTGGDVEYVKIPAANVTTSDTFVGVSLTDSTETATVDGFVDIIVPSAKTRFRGIAKTIASLASSQRLTKVVIDFTTPDYTVDESTTTNGICQIVDFDSSTGVVDFIVLTSEFVNA